MIICLTFKKIHIKMTCLILLISLAVIVPATGFSQGGKDTINYTSTCVNSTISFGSPVFDSLPFPEKVIWNFGDPASGIYNGSGAKQPKHIYATPGVYTIKLTVVNNKTDTVRIQGPITVVTPMNYNFGPDIFLCEGQTTLLNAPIISGALYTWNDDSTSHTDTLRVSKSGVYAVSIDGCGVNDSLGVYISSTPSIELGKDHIMCDSANLLLNAATQNGQYTWLLNGSLLAFTGDQLLTHAPGGTYVSIVTVPGCGVFKDTVSITYSSPLAPSFSIGPDTLLCPKQKYTITARLAGASAFDWSSGSTDSAITITQPDTYWVFVTQNGKCQVTDTVLVSYRGNRQLDFHDTAICQGSTLSLDANFGEGTYNWQAIPAQRDDQNQTGQATYFVYRPGTYAVTAQVGQCLYKDTLTVQFDDSLKVRMATDTILCNGEKFWLEVKGNADTYAWQDSTRSASYQVSQTGTYTVVAQNGCRKDTLTTKVTMVSCACQLLLPNAFTPDGNGINDSFRPLHACEMSGFQMAIYDRFGNRVFQTSDTDKGWDGSFNGRKVPPGTFIWMVHYINTSTKQPVFRKGSVLVIR
ncbi:T9SS type B sorting domain-containing protein [Flavitalea flava]